MTDARTDEFLAQRPRLFGLAYRMLGTAAEAEDVLQDAWLRYAGQDGVENPSGLLTTVVTRLCLDVLKSARVRREEYVGPWLPEPVPSDDDPDPETLSVAFLELCEKLSPDERAVVVLHEAFGLPMGDVGPILGKSEAACRKTLQRAREHLGGPVRRSAAPLETERLLFAFLAAAQSGDAATLAKVLREDAVWTSDGGGKTVAARRRVEGPARVAAIVLGLMRKAPDGLSAEIRVLNGAPALVVFIHGALYAVLWILGDGASVDRVYAVLNPDKLARLAARWGCALFAQWSPVRIA